MVLTPCFRPTPTIVLRADVMSHDRMMYFGVIGSVYGVTSNRDRSLCKIKVSNDTQSLRNLHRFAQHIPHRPPHMAASHSNPLVLYDINQSVGPVTTSPHVFKTKLTLHYKQIPYQIIRIHGGEVRSTLRPLGFKPTWYDQRGRGVWTLPSIIDPPSPSNPAPSYLSESQVIAKYLDSTYPSSKPVLPPAGTPLSERHEALVRHVENIVYPSLVRLVIPCSRKLYHDKDVLGVEKRFSPLFFNNKPFAEIYTEPEERAELWTSAREAMQVIASTCEGNLERPDLYQLKEGKPGVYIFGHSPTFVDIVLVAYFSWIGSIQSQRDPGLGTYWDEVRTWHDGRWERMAEAFERDYGCQYPKLPPISFGDRNPSLARL